MLHLSCIRFFMSFSVTIKYFMGPMQLSDDSGLFFDAIFCFIFCYIELYDVKFVENIMSYD